jgi:hypothetical protein
MDPKSIVLYLHLHRKGWMVRIIHDNLAATLGEKVIAYSTVTKYLREAQINPVDVTPRLDTTSLHFTSLHVTTPQHIRWRDPASS